MLEDVSLGELYLRAAILKQIIRECSDDPRVGEPIRQLNIIQTVIDEREKIMKSYQNMSIEQIEKERARIQSEIERLTSEFTTAGKILEARRKEADLVHQKEAIEQQIEAVQPTDQVVSMKTIILNLKSRLGG